MKKVNEGPLYEMWAGLKEPIMMMRHPDASARRRPRGQGEGMALSGPHGVKAAEEGLPSRDRRDTQPLWKP